MNPNRKPIKSNIIPAYYHGRSNTVYVERFLSSSHTRRVTPLA